MSIQDSVDRFGLVTCKSLKILATKKQQYLIENFMLKPSINILAGHSGLGKSALCAQMAMCVSSGEQFLGHSVVETGPVLYCDAESTPGMMSPMVDALARHMGLKGTPDEFLLWNPNWNINDRLTVIPQNKVQLYSIVKALKPKLVVLDSLRNFYPTAIKEPDLAAAMIKEMRKYSAETGCSWLIVHHLRKTNKDEIANNRRPSVRGNIHLWLEEASGTLALINNTDLRLGWEQGSGGEDDLWLGGFLRVFGTVGPYKIVRDLDDEGMPLGYRLGNPIEQLSQRERGLYTQVPPEFTFNYIIDTLRRSKNSTSKFIRHCLDLQLIRVDREVTIDSKKGVKMYAKNLFEGVE